jgi:molybdenum cofactor cytidylyltransferase
MSRAEEKTGGLILAAGRSSRFGGDKRELKLSSGKTMLETVVERYRQVLGRCIVVVDSKDWGERLSAYDVDVVIVDNAAAGMAHSLAAGISCAASKQWSGVLVVLADMPYVKAETISLINDALDGHKIVVPTMLAVQPKDNEKLEQWGHPVGFRSDYFEVMQKLTGDRGARGLVCANPQDCYLLPVDDPGVLQDIDTRQDWEQYQSRYNCTAWERL